MFENAKRIMAFALAAAVMSLGSCASKSGAETSRKPEIVSSAALGNDFPVMSETTTTAPPDEPEPEETAAETTTKKTTAAPTQTAQPETAAPAETTAPAKEQPPEETTKQTTAATSKQTSKTTEAPAPAAPDASKAETVVAYAKSNVGGSYVWGGASFKACDCSGLVMLAYSQVGISLPHYTGYQATYGRKVAYSDMQPGDCIYFGTSPANSYHVAMYIGGGRMVHAENSRTGIVISNVATFSIYNHICCIRRFL